MNEAEDYKSLDEAIESLPAAQRRGLKVRLLFWQYARLPVMAVLAIGASFLIYQGLKLTGMPEWLFEIANPVISMGAIIVGLMFGLTFTKHKEHQAIVNIYNASPFELPPPPEEGEVPETKTSFFS